MKPVWDEPYLETCCRSALHRLCLAGAAGRPAGLPDDPCLNRMLRMGLVSSRSEEKRFFATDEGVAQHTRLVLKPGRSRP